VIIMKIRQKLANFTPVTITFETQRELDDFMVLISESEGYMDDTKDIKRKILNFKYNTNVAPSAVPDAEKEEKFLVFKSKDIVTLRLENADFRHALETVIRYYNGFREKQGKNTRNKYIVCNQDEPYAEDVWQTILDGETIKNANN
jgi:hypothetical protein